MITIKGRFNMIVEDSSIVVEYKDKNSEAERRIYRNLALKFTNAIMHTYLNENIENTKGLREIAEEVLGESKDLLNRYDVIESLRRCDEGLTIDIMPNDFYNKELVKMLSNIPSFQIDLKGTNVLENGQLSPDIGRRIKDLKDDGGNQVN